MILRPTRVTFYIRRFQLMMDEAKSTSFMPESIDLRRYFFLLLQWAWLIAIITALTAGGAYIINWRTTPVFQASTSLLISEPLAARGSAISTDAMVTGYYAASTYTELVTDRPVLEKVINELNIPLSVEGLRGAITVARVRDTQVINLTVEDTDRDRAAAIANKISEVFMNRIAALQGARYSTSKENLQKQLTDMEAQLAQTTKDRADTSDANERDRLDTKLTQYRTIYSNLVTSYEQVRLAEAQSNTTVVQTDPATAPKYPIRPRTAQNTLLAGIVGLLLAAGGVIAADTLDDTLKDPSELSRRTGLPVIGVIPFNTIEAQGPVTRMEPRSPTAEAYRALRTNIQFSNAAHKINRLVITSPTPSDGKTTVSTNLSIIMAQSGRKVTLIDADLRRPQVHRRFGITNNQGVSGLFLREIEIGDAAQDVGIENLHVIATGQLPPNPAELLGSQRMGELLQEISATQDLVIVDSPPVLSVTDSAVMLPYVDGIILVVKVGQTHVSAIEQAVSNLRQVGANILGLVINGIKFSNSRYSYYSRSRYYSSYYYYSESYGPNGTKEKGEKRWKKLRKPAAETSEQPEVDLAKHKES